MKVKEKKTENLPEEKRQPPRVSTKRLAINLLIKIGAIALVLWITFTFVIGLTINYGNNMHPAVNDGDLVVSLKLQRPYLNSAVLFDTGLDIFNIKEYVSKLTKKELMVINSHFHPDHANGNHHFDKVYIGEADMPTFTTADVYF